MSVWQDVIERAKTDQQFRARLKANPTAACKEAGVSVPAGTTVKVIERQPSEIYLVLEPSGEELGDAELDAVAGGAGADGISRLIAVTALKADEANQDAMGSSKSKTPPTRPIPPKPKRPQ